MLCHSLRIYNLWPMALFSCLLSPWHEESLMFFYCQPPQSSSILSLPCRLLSLVVHLHCASPQCPCCPQASPPTDSCSHALHQRYSGDNLTEASQVAAWKYADDQGPSVTGCGWPHHHVSRLEACEWKLGGGRGSIGHG